MFTDRFAAGAELARALHQYRDADAVVLAIPRGGLQTGYAVARALRLPLDVALIKKIGHPLNPELAVGAVSLGSRVLSSDTELPPHYIETETTRLRALLRERQRQYLGDRAPVDTRDKTVIIVDDGIATGSTMLATIEVVKATAPAKVVVAVPVAPPETLARLRDRADEVVCLESPVLFYAVGQFYERFDQVEDTEAIRLLHAANEPFGDPAP